LKQKSMNHSKIQTTSRNQGKIPHLRCTNKMKASSVNLQENLT